MHSLVEILILGLMAFSSCASVPTSTNNLKGRLEFSYGDYVVLWELDEEKTELTLDLTVRGQGWFGIGFSEGGNMIQADMAVTQVITNDQGIKVLEVKDYHSVTSNNTPMLDVVQNLEDVTTGRNNTFSYARFTRALNTGDDAEDKIIGLDGIYVIWAFSENLEQMEYHRGNAGQEFVIFDESK